MIMIIITTMNTMTMTMTITITITMSAITITIRTWEEWGIDQLKEANPNLDPMAVWAQQLRDKAANFSGPGGERFFNELYLSASYTPEGVVKTSVLNDMDFKTTPLVGQMPTMPEIGGKAGKLDVVGPVDNRPSTD